MKRTISLLLILSMVIFIFSGCASDSGNVISAGTSIHFPENEGTSSNQDADWPTSNTEHNDTVADNSQSQEASSLPPVMDSDKQTDPPDQASADSDSVSQADGIGMEASITDNSIKTSELNKLNYLLYTPANAKSDMPLIVYLHGGSGKGDDLALLTNTEGFPQFLSEGKLGEISAYVIMPQLPKSKKGWTDIKVSLKELIEYITATYDIDGNRISLTGHSMGGTGAYGVAAAYPELFSCVVPMSGSIRNTSENIQALSNIPVWAIVGTNDTIVEPTSSREFISALSAYNSNAQITELDDAGHFDVPVLAYLDKELNVIAWLISNKK